MMPFNPIIVVEIFDVWGKDFMEHLYLLLGMNVFS